MNEGVDGMNISEIKNRYGIETDDLEEIRAVLRKLLKDTHPDSNNGNFDIDYFEKLKQDLYFIEIEIKNKNTSTSIDNVVNALIKTIHDYPSANKQEELQEKLEKNINNQMYIYKQKFRIRRYSLAAITAVLTFLWMLPEQVASHPILSFFIRHPTSDGYTTVVSMLTFVWLTSCAILAWYWIKTARNERLEKIVLERIKLASIQNDVFMSFIENRDGKKEFSKKEFMDFIRKYIYQEIISEKKFFKPQITKALYIDEIVVQNVADIIIDRALSHGLIQKWDAFSLLDYYKIIK